MKKIATVGVLATILTTCSVPATGSPNQAINEKYYDTSVVDPSNVLSISVGMKAQETMMQQIQELARIEKTKEHNYRIAIAKNKFAIKTAVNKLEEHVGKTWYVFSGSTPSGWDCSGLVRWTYSQIGISLEHSATKQSRQGKLVSEPKFGDIVVFKYNNSKNPYHVGIYVEDDVMIHVGQEGEKTSKDSITKFAGNHSKVSFVRILEN